MIISNVKSFMAAACLLVVIFSIAAGHAKSGGVTGRVECDSASCSLKGPGIVGEINETTVAEFSQLVEEVRRRATQENKVPAVSSGFVNLRSSGGSVVSAIALGRIMRKERMTVVVEAGAECNSACVLIYAGAVTRYGRHIGGKIGIHQPYFEVPSRAVDPSEVRKNYSAMLQEMRSYFREMNVSEQLADEMLKTSPADIRYLDSAEQDRLGLVVFDPIDMEVITLQNAQELGIDRAEYHRRQSLMFKFCYPDRGTTQGSHCEQTVMTTGKAPKPPKPSTDDLSRFGTPVR